MVPTRLMVWLLTSGLLLWLAGWSLSFLGGLLPGWASPDFFPAATGLVLGFDLGVLLLACADAYLAWRAVRPPLLGVRRERPARLSLGVANEIALVIDNHSTQRLSLLLRDQPPPAFPAEPGVL